MAKLKVSRDGWIKKIASKFFAREMSQFQLFARRENIFFVIRKNIHCWLLRPSSAPARPDAILCFVCSSLCWFDIKFIKSQEKTTKTKKKKNIKNKRETTRGKMKSEMFSILTWNNQIARAHRRFGVNFMANTHAARECAIFERECLKRILNATLTFLE